MCALAGEWSENRAALVHADREAVVVHAAVAHVDLAGAVPDGHADAHGGRRRAGYVVGLPAPVGRALEAELQVPVPVVDAVHVGVGHVLVESRPERADGATVEEREGAPGAGAGAEQGAVIDPDADARHVVVDALADRRSEDRRRVRGRDRARVAHVDDAGVGARQRRRREVAADGGERDEEDEEGVQDVLHGNLVCPNYVGAASCCC